MDKKLSKEMTNFINNNFNSTIQLVEHSDHRENADERAIQTETDHIIEGLFLTEPNFLIYIWDITIIPQVQVTLNMLRTLRTNPRISAQVALNGIFNFNKILLTPPGTRSLAYIDAYICTSWGTRGKDAWYA